MTTIIGIRTNVGEDGVVIASDTQLTITDENDDPSEKSSVDKIWLGRSFVMAYSGTASKELQKFRGKMSGLRKYGSGEEYLEGIIKRAIALDQKKQRRFIEVDTMNADIATRTGSLDDTVEFLFAINKPEFGMWCINPYGVLMTSEEAAKTQNREIDFEYATIGSGSDAINRYVNDRLYDMKDPMDANSIDLSFAIKFAHEAVIRAKREINTGGTVDITVITRNRPPESYRKKIADVVQEAENEAVAKIAARYKEIA